MSEEEKEPEIDLDFDDDLAADAAAFGLSKDIEASERGGHDPDEQCLAEVSREGPTLAQQGPLRLLMLTVALSRDVYGYTNSRYATMFCDWAESVIDSAAYLNDSEKKASLELKGMLKKDVLYWNTRVQLARESDHAKKDALFGRYCATNAARLTMKAVEAFCALDTEMCMQWMHRVSWCARQAVLKDDATKGYGRDRDGSKGIGYPGGFGLLRKNL
jgi:hypothetical protein